MHNSDTLQVSFSLSSREQRRAGRRMYRYRAPDLKRRYWLATLLFVVIFAGMGARYLAWQYGCDGWQATAFELLADRTFVAGDFLFALELFSDAAGAIRSAGWATICIVCFCRGFAYGGSGAHTLVLFLAGGVARDFGQGVFVVLCKPQCRLFYSA